MASIGADAQTPEPVAPKIDFDTIRNSPAFIPGLVALAAILLAFLPLIKALPNLWFQGDGYYSHGALVPFIAGYVVFKWWPKLEKLPVAKSPSYIALVPMAAIGWLLFAGVRIQQLQIISVAFVITLLLGIWFVAGARWMWALFWPVMYLFFMLPVWTGAIDNYTNPLQIISTEVSFGLLQLFGYDPLKEGTTTIHLNHFVLDVGVPCSGLKLVLAVTAFTLFFIMIGNMKWWANAIMLVAVLPLCLFINGLRIMMIGVVGEQYGSDAGHQFHDYSGYITLIICFFLLFKLARLIGWND